MKQTMSFQTEIKQLLKLMIHSLYSNKEIFLRELISNSSDALDKLKFMSISDPKLLREDLEIQITHDKDAKTITIKDNGIGMSYDEVIANIGTIAKSGTQEFMQKLSGDDKKDANLIGQFGVGFYSAFIVADKVELITLKAGELTSQGVLWSSDGTGDFDIEQCDKIDGAGTVITLHLKDDSEDLLSEWQLRSIIRKYSDHISYPIKMYKTSYDDKNGDESETSDKPEKIRELEAVNKASALWTRSRNDISDDDYQEFYKHISHDHNLAAKWVHARVEGSQEYIQLFYIPTKAPFDLYDSNRRYGIKLYINRVFIMDDAEKLLPNYLRFVRGIIDSQNIPLNVSREILQSSRDIDAIRSGCTKKILGLLEEIEENSKELYSTLWKEFGSVIKEGVIEDYSNKERVAKLCRFASTYNNSDEKITSLQSYIDRMKDGQDKIYYITAESYNAAKNSPHLEKLKQQNIEVLLLTDRVDEWVVSHLHEFENKSLVSVTKAGLDLGVVDNEIESDDKAKNTDLLEKIKKCLIGKVKDVVITNRLVDSPSCLVSDTNAMSAQMEKILRQAGQEVPENKFTLEINPKHKLIAKIEYADDEIVINNLSLIVFEQAQISNGIQLENPSGFLQRMNELLR